jgi:xylan 1,4-beta-xylosidase
LVFQHPSPDMRVTMQRVDESHGNVLPFYAKMGSPQYPSPAQIEELNGETALPLPEETKLEHGQIQLRLTPNTLVLVQVDR